MTAGQFWKWCEDNHVEDLEIGLQYQDGGGLYYGDTFRDAEEIGAEIKSFNENVSYILLE